MNDEQFLFCLVISAAWIVGWLSIALGLSDLYGPGYGGLAFGSALVVYALAAVAFMFYRERRAS
jgi:hypothetical protein